MPGAIRVGLDNVNGGAVLPATGVPTVLVNGVPVAVAHGAGVVAAAAHFPFTGTHLVPAFFIGSLTVFAGGFPVVRAGDLADCFDAILPGSTNVIVG